MLIVLGDVMGEFGPRSGISRVQLCTFHTIEKDHHFCEKSRSTVRTNFYYKSGDMAGHVSMQSSCHADCLNK